MHTCMYTLYVHTHVHYTYNIYALICTQTLIYICIKHTHTYICTHTIYTHIYTIHTIYMVTYTTKKENSELKPVKLWLKIDFVSHPVCAEVLGTYIYIYIYICYIA